MRSIHCSLLALALTGLIITAALAHEFDLSWNSIDGGGGLSAGGGFELEGSIGQADAGSAAGSAFSLMGGFWAGVQFAEPVLSGDCNGDRHVDLADFEVFQACLFGPGDDPGPACGCSDLDADGDIDLVDFAEFQAGYAGS